MQTNHFFYFFMCSIFLVSCKTTSASKSTSHTVSREDAKLKEDLTHIKLDASQMVQDSHKKLGSPANRDFHSKGICAKGTFTISAKNVPESMREGIFASDGVYPMYGRFSNGRPGRDSDDTDPSVFGLALKVIGVSGKKFDIQSMGSTKPANSNQDWNLATGKTFPIPTAALYREERESSKPAFALKHPKIMKALLASLRNINSYFTTSYFSQVALHYGEDFVAKFSVTPCNGSENDISLFAAKKRTPQYLKEDFVSKISDSERCFLFQAQIRPANHKLTAFNSKLSETMPENDPTVEWPEAKFPYTTIAKINFPKQTISQNLQDTCEALSFNPGNVLESFRPIESDTLMRARFLSAYEGSVSTRTSLNNGIQFEPAAVPKENISSWITEE